MMPYPSSHFKVNTSIACNNNKAKDVQNPSTHTGDKRTFQDSESVMEASRCGGVMIATQTDKSK
jgi:hypothetical protein